MSKYRKISQTFLYFGAIMVLIAADWHWYVGHDPENTFILELDFLPVIYVIYGILTAGCFIGAVLFNLKARPKSVGKGTGTHAGSRMRKAGH